MTPSPKYINSSKKYDWITPDDWFDFLDDVFGFTIDVAADKKNTKCKKYITPKQNSLNKSWDTDGLWWLNPPWGKQYKEDTSLTIENWIKKAYSEFVDGNEGVMLVPENPTTGWYYRNVKGVPYVFEPKGRIRFVDPKRRKASQPTKGTLVWIFVRKLSNNQIKKLNSKGRLSKTLFPKGRRPKGGFQGIKVAP